MPLTRATVTAASRIMLPTYVVLFFSLGVNYTLHPPRLDASPALAFAAHLLPLPVWGCVFLACGVLMLVALLVNHRVLFEYALWLAIVALAAWSGVFLYAAIVANVSVTAWEWPAFGVAACYASYRSLMSREVL